MNFDFLFLTELGVFALITIVTTIVLCFIYRKSHLRTFFIVLCIPIIVSGACMLTVGKYGAWHLIWGVILTIIDLIVMVFLIKRIVMNKINTLEESANNLYDGDFSKRIDKSLYSHNATEIERSLAAMDKYIDNMNHLLEFIQNIGNGKLSANLTPRSEKDQMSIALLSMRDNLVAAEEEKARRKQEDDQRTWAADGVAKFADILRSQNEDLEAMTSTVISNLVKYTNANQGAIFVINDEDKSHQFLSLSACYAYDRKKYINKEILPGEGLVGTCFLEGENIYMTDVPKDYINITSGLGETTPSAVFIVPMKINDEIYGVIELAGFNDFPPHVREFIEKISENVASTVSNIKTHIHTNNLLTQSRLQAEEMANQEEELRQNMEEMQATQEEAARREEELAQALTQMQESQLEIERTTANTNRLLDNLKTAFGICVLDPNFYITYINETAFTFLPLKREDMLHHNVSEFISPDIFKDVPEKINNAESCHIEGQDHGMNLRGMFTPYLDAAGNVEKIIFLFYVA